MIAYIQYQYLKVKNVSMLILTIFQYPDPKNLQINLTGFLNAKNSRIFLGEVEPASGSVHSSVRWRYPGFGR